jgi:hypothetical protein
MKRLVKKTKGIVKGVPSAVLLSALIHLILLSVAGTLIVFSVIKKPEKKFFPPPPVERPKMELKKPRVKVKKTSAPPAARHIVSKSVQSMPDLQLPDVSGIAASGLGGGLGGYDLMPDVSEISLYGADKSFAAGNDFEGTLYAFNYSRGGDFSEMETVDQAKLVRRFAENNWSPYVFAPYYRAPAKVYTTHFMIPPTASGLVPKAFNVNLEQMMDPPRWAIHYKGKICSKPGGRFRFWGAGIDILMVRVRGDLVFHGGIEGLRFDLVPKGWKEAEGPQLTYPLGKREAFVGEWFTLEPSEVVEMEVLVGELGKDDSQFMLLIEDAAETAYYSRREDGMPILPAFKTAEFPKSVKKTIQYTLMKEDADLDGGQLFNVY